jgi:hypothetical protein
VLLFFKKIIFGVINDSKLLSGINLNIPTRVLRNPRIFKTIFATLDVRKNMFLSRVQILCNEKFYHKNLYIFCESFTKIKKNVWRYDYSILAVIISLYSHYCVCKKNCMYVCMYFCNFILCKLYYVCNPFPHPPSWCNWTLVSVSWWLNK